MAEAFLSLGCNIGDCRANLAAALTKLDADPGVKVTRVSSVYITEPVGGIEQPSFLNMASVLETGLQPRDLLALCRRIEEELGGREGREHMGPRAVDLDILLYEQLEIAEGVLLLPHPHMLERAFVLEPLAEIAAGVQLPGGTTVGEALRSCGDDHGVEIDSARPQLDWRNEPS
ncbi:MAG: 2-amino-4-hydroxy-6-hydroxymethyldihydropteridine diphosphokinase [Thermoleophilia bacterium]